MDSNLVSLFNSACIPMRIPIYRCDVFPFGEMVDYVGKFGNCRSMIRAKWTSLSFSFIVYCTGLPVSPMLTLSHWNHICNPILSARGRETSWKKSPKSQNYRAAALVPYESGVSQILWHCLKEHNIWGVFKSELTLRKQTLLAVYLIAWGGLAGCSWNGVAVFPVSEVY